MTITLIVSLTLLLADPAGVGPDGPHGGNPVFRTLSDEGWEASGKRIEFVPPTVRDGMTEAEEVEALRAVAGSPRAAGEFTRDSVTAPLVMKTRDVQAGGGVIRQADLWFVVHAGLEEIDPDAIEGKKGGAPVEAGNMKFASRQLNPDDLAGARVEAVKPSDGVREGFVHSTGRLLDRIAAESTDRITATRTDDSWLIASQTDRRFDGSAKAPNRWSAITRRGAGEEVGPPTVYAGGAGYVKASRLRSVPGALLVEVHFAFHEPEGWFRGAPVLKSKFALVAQDRVRGLRRELTKSQKKPGARSSNTPGSGGR